MAGHPHFAVIDVETTGLSAAADRIIEVAVVTTDPWGRVHGEWSTRLNPQGPVGATHIHGITDADVARAPLFEDVAEVLSQQLAGAAIVAHNARFDLAFLRAEYRRAGWVMPHLPALCTLEASGYHLPDLDRRRLADCCWAVGTPLIGAHSALGDARATAGLLAAFMNPRLGFPPLAEHLRLPAEALSTAWPAGPTLSPAERNTHPTRSTGRRLSDRAMKNIRRREAAGPPPALVEMVQRFSLVDALDEGAPAGTVPYLEKLAEVLEDGELTLDETADLRGVAEDGELAPDDVQAAHLAFVLTLAHAALHDGRVTRAERAELQRIATLLDVDPTTIPSLLNQAEAARHARLSAGLGELPAGWSHGEPLRVGDKVVFTGCEAFDRDRLEEASVRLGVRVLSSVSSRVAMLITDGTVDGTKAARAAELGTRTVHPQAYEVLLQHLQPALPRADRTVPDSPAKTAVQHEAPTAASGTAANPVPLPSTNGTPEPARVRAWARAQGMEVGVRGRLSKEVLTAFAAAHSEHG